ncbi:hypothetical protein EDD22DRAFT_947876 [Suillus occidentalis]|nr:hypothetical protein EDD22DRAFT_947876 [Suillus occidentalis]
MPATWTRSSSQHRSRHSPTRDLPGRPTPDLNVPEVIVLSSDGENARPNESGSSRSKKKTIKKPKLPMREVLEISSSDEEPVLPKAPGNDGSSWQRENSKLKQRGRSPVNVRNLRIQGSISRSKDKSFSQSREIDAGHQDIKLQQEKFAALQAKGKSKSVDATELGDMLSCDICTHLMHSPYLLSDCGHCYCEGCLKGWFDETLTKHIRAHPTYDYWSLLLISGSGATAGSMQCFSTTAAGVYLPRMSAGDINFVVRDMVSLVGSTLGQPDIHREFSVQRAGPFDAFSPE